MMVLKKHLALALAIAVPTLVTAQTAPADQPAKPAGEQAATPPTPPPAKPAEPAKPAAPAAPKVTVTPYGFVQGTAFFDANTFTNKDYPGQVARSQLGGAFLMSARYSRFGVKLGLDDKNWTGATFGGEIEFDFKGGYVPTGTAADTAGPPAVGGAPIGPPSSTWYNGLMRLRLADVTATWKSPMGSIQLLAGQNYGLVCPLFATSITWTADPLFWMAGNSWRRDPQFRVTVAGAPELLGVNLAVAMLSPHTNDPLAAPYTSPDYGSGNASRMPDVEGRVGINTKLEPVTIAAGVGYSYGKRRLIEAGVTPAPTKPSVDVAGHLVGVDVSIGSQWIDVKGEWFQQKSRSDPYNTIAPAVGTTAGNQKGIESSGYWAQGVLKPLPEIWVTIGYGAEDVKNSSLAAAGITTSTTIRDTNSQLAGGIIINGGKFWKFGVEAIQTKTKYLDGLKETGKQVAVSSQFVF